MSFCVKHYLWCTYGTSTAQQINKSNKNMYVFDCSCHKQIS